MGSIGRNAFVEEQQQACTYAVWSHREGCITKMFKRQETIFASDIETSVTHKYSKANNVEAHPSHALSLKGTASKLLLPRGRGYLVKFSGKFLPIPRIMVELIRSCLVRQVWC